MPFLRLRFAGLCIYSQARDQAGNETDEVQVGLIDASQQGRISADLIKLHSHAQELWVEGSGFELGGSPVGECVMHSDGNGGVKPKRVKVRKLALAGGRTIRILSGQEATLTPPQWVTDLRKLGVGVRRARRAAGTYAAIFVLDRGTFGKGPMIDVDWKPHKPNGVSNSLALWTELAVKLGPGEAAKLQLDDGEVWTLGTGAKDTVVWVVNDPRHTHASAPAAADGQAAEAGDDEPTAHHHAPEAGDPLMAGDGEAAAAGEDADKRAAAHFGWLLEAVDRTPPRTPDGPARQLPGPVPHPVPTKDLPKCEGAHAATVNSTFCPDGRV